MIKALYCCLFLPVTILAALCTDTTNSFKFVCISDLVEVFQNIAPTSFKEEITLYKSFAGRQDIIALWVMQNFSNKEIIHDSHKHKVSLENGTVLLKDFQASDEAKYVMLYKYSSKRETVELCALYPPTLSCKPFIEHKENFRIASLNNPADCGKPLASVRWMEYPAFSYRNKTTIELLPGKEAGRYSVCVEGQVLKCVKNSTEWDKCENFTLESTFGNNSPTICDIPELKTTNFWIVVIVVIVLVVLFIVMATQIILLWKHFRIRLKTPGNPASVETEQDIREHQHSQDSADGETGAEDTENVPLRPLNA